MNSCKPTTFVCGWRYNRAATKLVVASALMQVAVRELRKYWLKGHNSKVLVWYVLELYTNKKFAICTTLAETSVVVTSWSKKTLKYPNNKQQLMVVIS